MDDRLDEDGEKTDAVPSDISILADLLQILGPGGGEAAGGRPPDVTVLGCRIHMGMDHYQPTR